VIRPIDSADPGGTPCACGHQMREHILDWDLDPEIDCRAEGCTCPEFDPQRAPRTWAIGRGETWYWDLAHGARRVQ
jgi:hypothetical protein